MIARMLITMIATALMLGCTSMKTVDTGQHDYLQKLEAGDHLVIYETSGRKVDMTFSSLENDIIFGSLTAAPLDTVEVRIGDIAKMEIEKISGAKTTAAVVGVIVLAPFAAIGAAMSGY